MTKELTKEQMEQRREKFAALIDKLVAQETNDAGRTQYDIAREMGYTNPNIITMFKSGRTRIPLDKVPMFARAVNFDPAALLQKWFWAFEPTQLEVLTPYLGEPVSPAERSWLLALRQTFGTVPEFDEKLVAALRRHAKAA